MATQLTNAIFTKEIVQRLERIVEENDIKQTLLDETGWPFSKSAPMVKDQLYYGLAFCREHGLDYDETCAYLAILYSVLRADADRWEITMNESLNHFSELLLSHSVERSPWSTKVFSEEHAQAAYEYTLKAYYMHFRMYKYCFTAKPKLAFMQNATAGIDAPENLLQYSLREAIETPLE